MMETVNEKGVRILTPDDGMFLCNGETYSQIVYLGVNASPEDWYEVDEIPVQEESEELTAEDALNIILGGDRE